MMVKQRDPIFAAQRTLCAPIRRAGFSMVELVVVIAVAAALMGLLMPAMSQVRENARRVVCASNERELGQSIFLFAGDKKDRLPHSIALAEGPSPRELMASRRATTWSNSSSNEGWDGLGLLFYEHYCPVPDIFYCPSHHGSNPYERYSDLWNGPQSATAIYTNYHYCGDIEWSGQHLRRSLTQGYSLVLVTDGLRSMPDFNHEDGMNMLHGDGSVRWRDNVQHLLDFLPGENQPTPPHYETLWSTIVEAN